MNTETPLRLKRLIIAALCVAVSVPALFVVWSKAAQLLNAKSDFSVLIGCAIILATLIAIGALVYFALTRVIFNRETNSERAHQQSAFKDGVQPKSLFSETTHSVEHINETDESKFERK